MQAATDGASPASSAFERYGPSSDNISPLPIPDERGFAYTAEGLEHDRRGIPSSRARDHAEQLAKRRDKLLAYDYGPAWVEIDQGSAAGPVAISLLTWGSSWGAVREAAAALRRQGLCAQAIALRLLAPLQRSALQRVLGASRILVVEINHSAQLFRYLHAERSLPAEAWSFARPGPLPLRPGEVIKALNQHLGD